MTREDYFEEIERLNGRITRLTAIRNQAEFECIKEHFFDYNAFTATYLRWQRKEGEYAEPQTTVL